MLLLNENPKILVRSPNWVGDAIMATPVIHALKQAWPRSRIHVLAKAWVAPVWEQHPEVEQIHRLEEGRPKFKKWRELVCGLKAQHFDLAVVLPNSFASAWLAFWAGCQQRIGYHAEGRGWLLTRSLPWTAAQQHAPRPQVYLDLACAAAGAPDYCREWKFIVQVSAQELARADQLLAHETKPLLVGIAPGSVATSRRWPTARYAELADHLESQGHRVVLLGSGPDRAIARRVQEQARHSLRSLAGETSLREALAIIKRLDLLVCNDSGAMHMAYAQDVPVVVLQGAADPRVTGPFGPKSLFLRDEGLACAPCVRNDCPKEQLDCMLNLTVEQVAGQVDRILGSGRHGKPPLD